MRFSRSVLHPSSRRSVGVLLFVGTALFAACGDGGQAKHEPPPGAAATGSVVGEGAAFEHFESAQEKLGIDFPASWKGAYTAASRADTTGGSLRAVEFTFKPDPSWKVVPQTLLMVRIFTKAGWDRLDAQPGQTVAVKIASRGDAVFALSLPSRNPYQGGTPAAARFDQMVLAVLQDSTRLRLTPR